MTIAKVVCQRCGNENDTSQIRCALCALPCPVSHGVLKLGVEVLKCDECAAAVRYSAAHKGLHCSFCGATATFRKSEAPERAIEHLPFAVDLEAASLAIATWLKTRGFFRPKKLASEGQVSVLIPIRWAGWLLDAELLVSYTGDSDEDAGRSRWAPHAGQSVYTVKNQLVSASRGLSFSETQSLAPHYVRNHDGWLDDPESVVVEDFGERQAGASGLLLEQIYRGAYRHAESQLPGTRKRNVSVGLFIKSTSASPVTLPCYVATYRYRGRPYRAVVHGHASHVVIGELPIAWGRVLLCAAAVALLVAVLGFTFFPR